MVEKKNCIASLQLIQERVAELEIKYTFENYL